jgi:hypothetical protein
MYPFVVTKTVLQPVATTGNGKPDYSSGIVNTHDLLDSTTTPLQAGNIYVGGTKVCRGYARLVGTVYSDQACVLTITQGDYVSTFNVGAGTALGFSVEVVTPTCQMTIGSVGVNQTFLRAYLYGRVSS